MKLLNIDLTSTLTATSDTTHVDPIKEVVEKYARRRRPCFAGAVR